MDIICIRRNKTYKNRKLCFKNSKNKEINNYLKKVLGD